MRLLICTQSVNLDDPILGFFHRWIEKIAERSSATTVVCLFKGRNELPSGIPVLSLGKELCATRFRKIYLFFTYIIKARSRYDAVFVHMNKEYVIMGWVLWKILGKKVIFWYNHPFGDMEARLAGALADVVMYTSPHSFFGSRKKGIQMPVGIDTDLFFPKGQAVPLSVASVGRISPVKNVDAIVDAFSMARIAYPDARLDLYGSAPNAHAAYASELKRRTSKAASISWKGDVNNSDLPAVYSSHAVCANATDSGSFDKVICEAMSCERLVVASNATYRDMVPQRYRDALCPKEKGVEAFAACLKAAFAMSDAERSEAGKALRSVIVERHSLDRLVSALAEEVES